MNLVKIISIVCVVFCIGCSKPDIVYKTNYEKVNIPVMVQIDKPDRPKYTKEDNTMTYLAKVLAYTEILETIITNYNDNRGS